MRHVVFILLAVLLSLTACQQKPGARGGPAKQPGTVQVLLGSGEASRLALVFSASESDPWTSEIVATAGAALGIEPWKKAASREHLDIYGPYDAQYGRRKLRVSIVLLGLSGVADLPAQQAVGAQALEWLRRENPATVWLDGDQAQFLLGRSIGAERGIVITGGKAARETYFDDRQRVTGAYRRPSLARVIRQVLEKAPGAKRLALISDDSMPGQAQVAEFMTYERAAAGQMRLVAFDPVTSWQELRGALARLGKDADAAVLCGIGSEGAPAALLDTPCPSGMLEGVKAPVVVLGPSRAGNLGAVVLSIKPSAHAKAGLSGLEAILERRELPPVSTPDDMAAFLESRS